MAQQASHDPLQAARLAFRTYRYGRLAGLLVWPVVAVRKLTDLADNATFGPAVILLIATLLLYLAEPYLIRRSRWLSHAYYLTLGALILALGWLPPYEDTWAILYFPLSMSIWFETPRRDAVRWTIFNAGCLAATMFFTFGWFTGLGYSLSYISACTICISCGHQAVMAELAEAKTQRLLEELQGAHARLKEYASQAEELAAAQEHERLIRELHDSVSQTIFSVSLTAEAARLLLQKDPGRVPEQLGRLQELTGQALGRMRALISQWRPG